MSAAMSDRAVRVVAGATAGAMGGALALATLLSASPAAAATERAARPALAELDATVAAGPSTTLLFVARGAVSPCEADTARYRAAQAALAAGDIDAADDVAVIAQALIAECGWTNTDAALGGRHGN